MPLRFLDLPQEIQDMIYRYHIQCDTLTVRRRKAAVTEQATPAMEATSTKEPTLTDHPMTTEEATPAKKVTTNQIYIEGSELAIELVCRKVSRDAKQLRSRLWPRILRFPAEETTREIIDLVATNSIYAWLHDHINCIVTDAEPYGGRDPDLNVGFEWPEDFDDETVFKFRNLQYLTARIGQPWWSSYTNLTSLEALHGRILRERLLVELTADICGTEVTFLSGTFLFGDTRPNITLTLIQEAQLKERDRNVEIVSEIHRCVKGKRRDHRLTPI